jgi:hypothetical protein
MNRWRVGDDRGSKEKDRCPLTVEVLRMTSGIITSDPQVGSQQCWHFN